MIPAEQIDTPSKVDAWRRRFRRFHTDRRWAIENHFKIRTKDQRLVNLVANEAQVRLDAIVAQQEAEDIPVRVIGVKPRKVGISTWIQALFFHRCITRPLQKAMTVAHDLESTAEMFQMDDLFYNELPEQMRPMKRYGGRQELVFENPDEESRKVKPGLRSQLTIGTAGKVEAGRSKDIHLLHCSESSYWAEAEATELSLLNAVPDLPSTMVFKESTPAGVGTKFHKDFLDAKAGRTAFAPYFMAWWEFKEYSMPLPLNQPREAFEDTLDDTERKHRAAFNLTLEQLAWRRWAIENKCGRDPMKFIQEYPHDDVSCFLVSGRPRFDGLMLNDMLLTCTEPAGRGYLREEGSRIIMEQNARGFVRIWKPPSLRSRYIMGADVAEGLEHGDYSVGHVHEWDTGELVAEWHGHIEPDDFGKELAKLGKVYNQCLIAVESNKDGGTVNTRLKNDGYPHLFYRQELDRRTNRQNARLGWLTTSVTKPIMINSLADALKDGVVIPSKETIEEMMTFVYLEPSGLGAQAGCFDDRVISSAIAMEVRKRHSLTSIFPSLN